MSEPKIVFFDLETLPDLKEVLKVFPGLSAYPGLTLKAQINSIICFGYKNLGDDDVTVVSAWNNKRRWLNNVNDDRFVCEKAYEILKDADAVVTFNGKSFDWKFLQTRLSINGLPLLHRIPHIDMKNVIKSNLYLFNNRLQTLAQVYLQDKKLEHDGWDLWVNVFSRQVAACKKMAQYCAHDVVLLEKAFKKFRPLIQNIPNYTLWNIGKKPVCPSCASTRLHGHGYQINKTKKYQRYKCQDCGSMSRVDSFGKTPRAV